MNAPPGPPSPVATRDARGRPPSVALVHDWLVGQRGGENVLLELCALFPGAPIYTLVYVPGAVDPRIEEHPIHASFIQRLPGAPRRFRGYLPLFPRAIEAFDLRGHDLVVSTSHCVAKGARAVPPARHVSYVHTPMRYVWDHTAAYVRAPLLPAARVARLALRRWDVASAARPDRLVANSQHVAERVRRLWGREATVVPPPVDVEFFARAAGTARSERRGLLAGGALVAYKRLDLAVQAARALDLPLTVFGAGPERPRLERLAGPRTRFVGLWSREELRHALAEAAAFVFPGEEDFGILPVEAMAAGCPVVAYGRGGALETVEDGVTGVFFDAPTVPALVAALRRVDVEAERFDPTRMVAHARRFDRARFARRMREICTVELAAARGRTPAPVR